MKVIDKSVTRDELKKMAELFSGELVKAVVDIKNEIMIVDAPMHADEEKELLEMGSNQDDLWGINLYPDLEGDDFVEFDSMINVRPRLSNFSRNVEDPELQEKIVAIVKKLVK
jgi:hypothetical protein